MERYGGRCVYCGDLLNMSWHIDHVIPTEKGGTNDESNLVTSCGKCNIRKGNRTIDEFRFHAIDGGAHKIADAGLSAIHGMQDYASKKDCDEIMDMVVALIDRIYEVDIKFYGDKEDE